MKRTIALVILAASLATAPWADANTEQWRWPCQTITVSAGPDVNLDYLRAALTVVKRESGLPFELVSTGGQVTVVRDASVDGGHAWVQHGSGGTAFAATVRIGPKEWQSLYTHEFGHVVGLDHSSDRRDLMHPSASAIEFSPTERARLRELGCPTVSARSAGPWLRWPTSPAGWQLWWSARS